MSSSTPAAWHPRDLADSGDIECLVNAFYSRVRGDAMLGFIFDDVARVDWGAHLPKIYAFWDSVLFRGDRFAGDLIGAHARLVSRTTMGPAQFARWVALFEQTVDELYAGHKAEHAKAVARDLANVIHASIHGIEQRLRPDVSGAV